MLAHQHVQPRQGQAQGHTSEPRDKPVLYALLALLWFAPLPLGSKRGFAVALLVFAVFALTLLAVWLWRAHAALALQRLRRFGWPLGLLAALTAWQWLQTLPLPESWVRLLSPEAWAVQNGVTTRFTLSLEPLQTHTQASLTLALALVFALAVLVLRRRERIDTFAQGLVWVGVFQALLALLLWSAQARYPFLYFEVEHSVTKGSFGNRNHFAGFIGLCLSVGIGLMLARLGTEPAAAWRGWRIGLSRALAFVLSDTMRLRLMLVVMVIALVLTRSRMGNTAFFAALLVTGALALLMSRRAAPAMVALIVSLVVIDVAVVGTWVGLEQVVQRVQNTDMLIEQQGSEESVEQRQQAARYALALVRDFPLTGTGAGTFYGVYPRYRVPGTLFFDHAHNDYIELLADLGAVGFALLAALVLLSAGLCLRMLQVRSSSMPRGMAFGVLMALVGMGLHSLVDFNLQIPANALAMVSVLALGWSAWALPGAGQQSAPLPHSPRHFDGPH